MERSEKADIDPRGTAGAPTWPKEEDTEDASTTRDTRRMPPTHTGDGVAAAAPAWPNEEDTEVESTSRVSLTCAAM